MANPDESRPAPHRDIRQKMIDQVGQNEVRKLKAHREKGWSIWFGLGMMGVVGWSVAAPTVLGAALGMWIDATWPSRFSWTLTLLFIGLLFGCLTAWQWIARQQQLIEAPPDEAQDE